MRGTVTLKKITEVTRGGQNWRQNGFGGNNTMHTLKLTQQAYSIGNTQPKLAEAGERVAGGADGGWQMSREHWNGEANCWAGEAAGEG